jgi:hypothetical protein
MKALLRRMLDEEQFLSPFGIRSVSREHLDKPYELEIDGQRWHLAYTPGESVTSAFGGNSNWRGPVWFPMNYMIVESLYRFHTYYGDDFRVECPTGSGQYMSLAEVAQFISRRLSSIFLPGKDGVRPVHGATPRLDTDPVFQGNPSFFEYFHGDLGHGLGASHQCGWTATVAMLLGRTHQASLMRLLK